LLKKFSSRATRFSLICFIFEALIYSLMLLILWNWEKMERLLSIWKHPCLCPVY